MRKLSLVLFLMLIVLNSHVSSQDKKIGKQFKNRFSFSLGMGISMSNTPSFVDYIRNDVPFSNKDSVKAFGVGLEFFGGLDYDVSKNFTVKLDYSYFIKSLTYNYSYFTYDYFYSIHQPYLMGFYVIRGTTYQIRFGGGLGYHFAQMKKDIGASSDLIYNASGLGYRAQVEFIASLSKKMNSYVSGFVNGSSIGTLKDGNKRPLINANSGEEVNLSGFGIGIRLGLSYYIN